MFNWVFSLLNIVTVLIYFFFFNLIPLRDLVFAASAASIEVSVIARQDDKVCDENLRYYDNNFNCLVFFLYNKLHIQTKQNPHSHVDIYNL